MTKKESVLTFDGLLDKVKTYITNQEELDLITSAYRFAYEKHFGVKRLTGEDYIIHPLNVAYILSEISADSNTICAALLHDVIEDCGVTRVEIEERFNKEVALLVDGVTKINRLNFTGDNEAVLANHRKILVGLSEDVRVIIIKLADRLHNMRTLWVIPEKSQKEKAKETLDILIPIAHRLGMNQIKSELEDLSLRYYKSDIYFSIVEKLNQSKVERDKMVEDMELHVSELLNNHGIKHEIKGRAKSIYSIYKKLDTGRRFSDIYDLLALRVFVDNEQDCYQALGIIHSKYKPIPKRFKDYIAMPKTNMYQSLHTTVFGDYGSLFEIQIRTYEMDKIAENGIASHWSYKEKNKTTMQNEMEQKLQFFRSIMDLKDDEPTDEEFVKSVTDDVFKDTIYVFTPKGDVIELPAGSSPIDFAYRVHSIVGDKMIGAIVNNNIVPLDYVLKDSDIVKINTNKNALGPSREWINMAKTTQAKNKIKAFFNKIDKNDYLKKGEESLTKELRKRKISSVDFMDNISKVNEQLKINDLTELYMSIGNNKFTANQVVNIMTINDETKDDIILKKKERKDIIIPNIKNDVLIEGIDDIKFNSASCCRPIPGDEIVGFITKGKGITIHRVVCPNMKEIEERFIDVKWNEQIDKKYPTSILVHASENKKVLLDIISKTSNSDITIDSISTLSSNNGYIFDITIMVESLDLLNKFINDVYSIKNIIDVERLIR